MVGDQIGFSVAYMGDTYLIDFQPGLNFRISQLFSGRFYWIQML